MGGSSVKYRVLTVETSGKVFTPLSPDKCYREFVEGVDPRTQAEAVAHLWCDAASGRLAIVVADITTFKSGVIVETDHPVASVRKP